MLLTPRCAFAALALAFLPPVADTVAFQPAAGLEVSKEFGIEGTFGLGDVSLVVDGQDMSSAIGLDGIEGKVGMTMAVVDRYLKSVDGRPVHLERRYDKSASNYSMMEESGTADDLFELDGETVVFLWNAERGEYERSFKDGEGEEAALDGLGIDLDYRSLLPGKAVAEGDTWEVAPKDLVSALFLGADAGELLSAADEDAEFSAMAAQFGPALERLFGGFKAQCRYVGAKEIDGVRVAEIRIEIDSDGTLDMRDLMLGAIQGEIEDQGAELDLETADLKLKIRGEGSLLWDLGAHHARSFELDTDLDLAMDMAMNLSDPQGGDHSAEMNLELFGKLRWTMR